MMTEQFAVTGMTCAACSAHVEKAVSRLSGVQSAPVNLMLGSMTVTYDEKAVTEGDIIAAGKGATEPLPPLRRIRASCAGIRTPPSAAGRSTSSGRWYFWCRCST